MSHEWIDFNRNGEVDFSEEMMGGKILCGSRKEHRALFGDDDYFGTFHDSRELYDDWDDEE